MNPRENNHSYQQPHMAHSQHSGSYQNNTQQSKKMKRSVSETKKEICCFKSKLELWSL